jgi:hypothetical protein
MRQRHYSHLMQNGEITNNLFEFARKLLAGKFLSFLIDRALNNKGPYVPNLERLLQNLHIRCL